MQITVGRAVALSGLVAGLALVVWAMLPKPVQVDVVTVRKGTFVATVDEDGKTRIRERYVVAAPLAGRLTRVRFKAGDSVEADQVVAAIQPTPAPFLDPRSRREAEERLGTAEAARERTKMMVERARVQAAQARADFDRTSALKERGVSTAQALERVQTALRVSERDLRAAEFQDHAAEHELEQAKALLEQYRNEHAGAPPERWNVTAPVPGVVLNVTQESETVVQPGTPILTIGDRRDLEVVADVLSTDAVEIRPGAEVAIENWGGPGVLAGRVRRVEPAAFTKISTLGVEEQRVNVLIDIVTPEKDWTGLGDAYQVDVRITVFGRDDATIVPSGALFRTGETWNVYVVNEGRAQLRPVNLLRRSGRLAAVTEGVEPGERVIVYPSDRVAAGVRVTPHP
ncbi:MAG TPA: HlyD family efflux transporter periplasmic adaptor subunit [Pseudolabrys sp.]|nr:HlyD family efflux transporter periplasmic adaptor subunit [Pseudolabrys sp.]